MPDFASLQERLENLPLPHLETSLSLICDLANDLVTHHSLLALHRDLDRILSAFHCIYYERTFTVAELHTIPRYRVYRHLAFGISAHSPIQKGIDIDEAPSEAPPAYRDCGRLL